MPKPRNRERGHHRQHQKPAEKIPEICIKPIDVPVNKTTGQGQYLDFVEDNWSYDEAFSFAQRGLPYGS